MENHSYEKQCAIATIQYDEYDSVTRDYKIAKNMLEDGSISSNDGMEYKKTPKSNA